MNRGPVNAPIRIHSFGDFERRFGGLDAASETSYAVSQFFTNGGGAAVVSRIASSDAATASVNVAGPNPTPGGTYGAPVVKISAADPGAWGNGIHVTVDYDTEDPASLFTWSPRSGAGSPTGPAAWARRPCRG